MKEIVKYHNDFNKIKLPNFTEQEQNLLFGIIGKIRETGYQDKIIFTSQELLKFSTEHLTNKALGDMLIILREKFFKADFTILIEDKERDLIGKEIINLFSSFKLWYSKKDSNYTNLLSVELQVNPKFTYLVNELTANFTGFELAEFIAISGKYTKTLYRLLKQYRQTGYLKMEWQEFVRVMDIPTGKQIGEIDRDILKPALRELTKPRNLFDQVRIPFEKLTYTKIKGKGRGRGGNVIGIEFAFAPQKKEDDYIPTKDQTIANLRAENEELIKENFENNLAKSQNQELQERIAKLEKIAYGVGLYAYCGFKYYSEKNETLRVLSFDEIKNPSDNNKYQAEILNEKTNKSFFVCVESPKHLMNLISKNEKDLFFHNQEIINQRFKTRPIY